MRPTFGAWRSMSIEPMYTVQGMPSRAQAAAVATPCWPAPVSATMRRAPSRLASRPWPIALLILCAPVWARSSRLSQTSAPQRRESSPANVSGVGPSDPGAQLRVEFGLERGIRQDVAYALLESVEGRHQRFGDIAPAERDRTAHAHRERRRPASAAAAPARSMSRAWVFMACITPPTTTRAGLRLRAPHERIPGSHAGP